MFELENNNVIDLPNMYDIEKYAKIAINVCPKKIENFVKKIKIVVDNFAGEETTKELKIENINELLGIYKIYEETGETDLILYRGPIILYAQNKNESIRDVVARVVIYELSHRTDCKALRQYWMTKVRKYAVNNS